EVTDAQLDEWVKKSNFVFELTVKPGPAPSEMADFAPADVTVPGTLGKVLHVPGTPAWAAELKGIDVAVFAADKAGAEALRKLGSAVVFSTLDVEGEAIGATLVGHLPLDKANTAAARLEKSLQRWVEA